MNISVNVCSSETETVEHSTYNNNSYRTHLKLSEASAEISIHVIKKRVYAT